MALLRTSIIDGFLSTGMLNALENDLLSHGGPFTATTIYKQGDRITHVEVRPTERPGVIDFESDPVRVLKIRK